MSATLDNTETSVSIKTGGLDVIANGTVLLVNDEVEFTIKDLRISFIFITDKNKKQSISSKIQDDNLFNIYLINFNNSLGSGCTNVLEIGHMRRRALFMSFIAYKLTESSLIRKLEYTFYLGNEVQNG